MMKRAHVMISGHVQGVFYRASTKQQAQHLGVTGWVRNMDDGRVEALFEGEDEAIQKMIAWCHNGPASAKVSDVKVQYLKFLNEFKSFSIRYD